MEKRRAQNVAAEVSGLDARFECPICLLCLKDPVLTSCGHRFCTTCIQEWLKKKNSCCPVDNQPLEDKDIFPDNYTRREILTQTIPCSVCNKPFSLSEIDDHLSTHDSGQCYFHDVGCNIEMTPGGLKEHLEQEMHYHMRLLHAKVKLFGGDPKSEEVKLWEAGKESEKSNSLLRVLYERVVLLEQRSHEQECQIQRQRREAMCMEKKMDDISLRHCFGEYLWKIEDFRNKIQELVETQSCHFSPGFYTSPAGYKFCARINVATHNPEFLTIVLHLMQSENDIALPWPFAGSISLAVLHPTEQDWSILDTLTADPNLEAFARPAREINPKAYGYTEYARLNVLLENDEFLVNGALYIKILIQSGRSA